MTAALQPESKSPSRRALVAGALGAIGAVAATVIGRASPVRGADGDAVLVGSDRTGANTTKITVTTANYSAFWGNASAASGTGVGVRGDTAAAGGRGVWGNSRHACRRDQGHVCVAST